MARTVMSYVVVLLSIALQAKHISASSVADKFAPPKHDYASSDGVIGEGLLSSSVFGVEYLRKVESALKSAYGDAELQFFRKMIHDFEQRLAHYNELPTSFSFVDNVEMSLDDPDLEDHIASHMGKEFMSNYSKGDSNESDEMRRTARALVLLIKEQFHEMDKLHEIYVKPNLDRFSQIQSLSKQVPISTDTPCSMQAGCDRLEMLINLCSYIRGGTHTAYEIFVIMVHVLGTMMAVLCGCIFAGPAKICFLQNFPYTCRIPFPVFSGLFQATTSVWQLVKVVTNICRIYGDPGFGSIFA